MNMEMTDKFAPVSDVISTELEGEAVLMHVAEGKYFSLNDTGSLLWRKLEEKASSLEELVDAIIGEFEVEEAQCRLDVERLLASMVDVGILEKKS